MSDNVETLKARIETLEKELADEKSKGFWHIGGWQDAVKACGVPLALVLGLYTVYDDVYLRVIGQDRVTRESVVDGLAKLHALDETTFTRQAGGDSAGASAVDAAQRGQRERLVSRTFEYWQRAPDFFERSELDTLAHHLILQGRTREAISVIDALVPGARGGFDKADLLLKKGRAFAEEGDAHDLPAARAALDEAIAAAEQISARGTRNTAVTNITFYRVFMELQNEQACHHITQHMTRLAGLSAEGTAAETGLDADIARLGVVTADRCG